MIIFIFEIGSTSSTYQYTYTQMNDDFNNVYMRNIWKGLYYLSQESQQGKG